MPFEDYLRIANMFAPQSMNPVQTTAGGNIFNAQPVQDNNAFMFPDYNTAPDDNAADYAAMMNPQPQSMNQPVPQTFSNQPRTPAMDAYVDSANSMPPWERPSWMRMLGTGALSALQFEPDRVQETINAKGEKTTQRVKGNWSPFDYKEAGDILHAPMIQKRKDWEQQTEGLGKAAAVETARQNAESLQQSRINNAIVADRRENRNQDQGDRRLQQGERALDIRLMDTQTKQRLASLKTLTDAEQIQLLQDGKISQEELRAARQYTLQQLRGQQAQSLEGTRTVNDLVEIQERDRLEREATAERIRLQGEQNRELKGTPSADSGVNSQLPTQQRTGMQAKVARIIAANPQWKEWISFDANGYPVITPHEPGRLWDSGPSKEDYEKIKEAVFGPAQMPETKKVPLATAPQAPKGWKYVPKPGGGWTAVRDGGN